MIDPKRETVIPFNKAPEFIPGRPHLSTVHRWRLRYGVPESFLLFGRRYTSIEAVQRLIECRANPSGEGPGPDSPADQHRKAVAADRAKSIFDAR